MLTKTLLDHIRLLNWRKKGKQKWDRENDTLFWHVLLVSYMMKNKIVHLITCSTFRERKMVHPQTGVWNCAMHTASRNTHATRVWNHGKHIPSQNKQVSELVRCTKRSELSKLSHDDLYLCTLFPATQFMAWGVGTIRSDGKETIT